MIDLIHRQDIQQVLKNLKDEEYLKIKNDGDGGDDDDVLKLG